MADESTSPFEFMFPSEIWGPVSSIFSSGMSLASFILFWLLIITIAATYVDATKEIPGAWNPWVIFWLVLLNGIILLLIAWWFGPINLPFLGEVFTSAPNTCVGEYGSSEGGLCYKNCREGYHGFGVRCYADTVGIGAGTVVGLEPCRDGYRTEGLLCSSVRWGDCAWKFFGKCVPGLTGDVYGRLDGGGVCPGPQDFGGNFDDEYKKWKIANDKGEPAIDPATGELETLESANKANHKTCDDTAMIGTDKHVDKREGMCYKKCPAGYPEHVPGMPYLCYRGGELSYDRGGGQPPHMFRVFGKYPIL
jgi:hypothetical protein